MNNQHISIIIQSMDPTSLKTINELAGLPAAPAPQQKRAFQDLEEIHFLRYGTTETFIFTSAGSTDEHSEAVLESLLWY